MSVLTDSLPVSESFFKFKGNLAMSCDKTLIQLNTVEIPVPLLTVTTSPLAVPVISFPNNKLYNGLLGN